MGNSLRCWLACVLPCGALDVIRVVHMNGDLEEITRPITAGEVLKNNPNHILSKPCSQGMSRRILILSPESELKKGSIYFLIPASSPLPEKKKKEKGVLKKSLSKKSKKCSIKDVDEPDCIREDLSESVAEKKTLQRDRRKQKLEHWRPHLEGILEDQ